MEKADPLLRTKLHQPFTRSGIVSRPRLQEQIRQGLRGPLTLIAAPAGFGKTTLVASCVASCGTPREPLVRTAWLSLDKDDNQTRRFLTYLIAAFQSANLQVGSEAAQLAMQQAPLEAVLTSFINDLESAGEEMVLVLDDCQFITSPAVHTALTFLLDHCPQTLHLLIATRSNPPLPLARLRAGGQLVELRTEDLRFTPEEASQFLNDIMGLDLDAGAVAALEERTEGWIAGLQMAALALQGTTALQSHRSMRDRNDVREFIEGFSGTNRYILDYLLEEVLARESEDVQTFLLQTSVLTRLSGPLCDIVTGAKGGQEMLERLERRNLFVVPLDYDRHWYRYHHLFAELLRAKLYQSGPDQAALILSRAAQWCEQHGQVAEAVSYILAAQDYGAATRLITKYWQLMTNNGEIETVWSWLHALPEDIVRNSAALSDIYCWVLWLSGQTQAIKPHLVDAERAMGELDGSKRWDKGNAAFANLPAELAALRSYVARYQDDYETAREHAERALCLIPENLPPRDNAQLHAVIWMPLAMAYDGAGDLEKAVNAYTETIHWSRININVVGIAGTNHRLVGALRMLGRLRQAEAACRDAMMFLQTQGFDRQPAAGILHVSLSEVLIERNDLNAAEAHLDQGIELGKWSGRLSATRTAAYALSRLRQARGDLNGALAAVQTALDETPPSSLRAEVLAIKTRVLVRQGSLNEAANCIKEAVHLAGRDRGQIRAMVDLAAARVLLAQGRLDTVEVTTTREAAAFAAVNAVSHLTGSLTAAEGCGWFGAAIELHILRCLALSEQDDTRAAETDLERALVLAELEGYTRIFLDEGQPMRKLLAQWLLHHGDSPLHNYAIQLLAQFDPIAHDMTSGTLEKAAQTCDRIATEVRPAKDMLAKPVVLIELLSQRELEVLQLMAAGRTNQEIAGQLVLALGTVKAHAASIYRKLDVAHRAEAVARARQLGILP